MISEYEKARIDALQELRMEIDNCALKAEMWSKKRIDYSKKDLFSDIDVKDADKHTTDHISRLCTHISEELRKIIDMPTQSYCFQKREYDIEKANKCYAEYDKAFNCVLSGLNKVVDTLFVEEFNKAFKAKEISLCDNKDFLGLSIIERRTNKGSIEYTKKAIINYLSDYLYQIRMNGANNGVEHINDIWVQKKEYGFRIQEDKYKGLFLFKYVIEQMFPNDDDRFKNMNKLSYVAVKLNAPNSEWRVIYDERIDK